MSQDYSFVILRIFTYLGVFPSLTILGFTSVIPSKDLNSTVRNIQDTFLHLFLLICPCKLCYKVTNFQFTEFHWS
jgi:hypothetical protein